MPPLDLDKAAKEEEYKTNKGKDSLRVEEEESDEIMKPRSNRSV